MILPRCLRLGTTSLACAIGALSAVGQDIASLFRPFQTEHVALAPDGRHLAYSERQDDLLRVLIVNLETNRAKEFALARDMVEPMSGNKEKTPVQLTHLRWATADRLILSIEDLVVWGLDADGGNARVLVRARDLARQSSPAQARRTALQTGSSRQRFSGEEEPWMLRLEREAEAALAGEEFIEEGETLAMQDPELIPFGQNETGDVFETRRGPANRVPRRASVLDLPVEDPEFIYVEARGAIGSADDGRDPGGADVSTGYYKVNIRTGKFAKEDSFVGVSRVLGDQQGRPRVLLSHLAEQRDFLHAAVGMALTRSLDKAVAPATGPFRFSPGTYLQQRSIPLAFGRDPNVLYYASNAGQDRFGIFALNLATRERVDWAVDHSSADLADFEQPLSSRALVFDRHSGELAGLNITGVRTTTRWFDAELARVQATLEVTLPEKTVQILEWDRDRSRFLVSAWSQTDPGTFYLFDRAQNRLVERARRAPWLEEEVLNPATTFSFRSKEGVRLSGYLTLPRQPRRMPAPLLVYCHDGPWNRDLPGFNRGAQALASMGFAVAQVNFRGSSGFGVSHLQALREGFDTVALQDVLATIDHLTGLYEINPKLVAILGNGYGGYLALRALQLHPTRFRCAVSMNAPTDLPAWLSQPATDLAFRRDVRRSFFGADHAKTRAASPVRLEPAISLPVLIVQGSFNETVPASHALALRRALERAGNPPEYLELPGEGHAQWLPGTYVRVFQKLEEFFNASIYNYRVELGEAIEVK